MASKHVLPSSLRRKADLGVRPIGASPIRIKLAHQARHCYGYGIAFVVPSKCADAVATFALHLEGLIIAFGEQPRMQSPEFEQLTGDEQFLAAVPPVCCKICKRGTADFVQ